MGPNGHFTHFYSYVDPVWSVEKCWDRLCILGRALRTKETLPDFHEWCRVTQYLRIFRELTGCQQDPREWGVTSDTWFPCVTFTSIPPSHVAQGCHAFSRVAFATHMAPYLSS